MRDAPVEVFSHRPSQPAITGSIGDDLGEFDRPLQQAPLLHVVSQIAR